MFCIKCGEKLNDGATFCTKCGAQQNNNQANNNQKNQSGEAFARTVFILIGFALVCYGSYWFVYKSGYLFSADQKTNTSILITKQYASSKSRYVVEATGTNNGDKSIEHISTEFTCYDKDGVIVGTADDYLSSKVEPRETWSIEADLFVTNAKSIKECKLESVEAHTVH